MKRKWPNRSGAPAGRDDKRLRFKGQPQGAIAGVLVIVRYGALRL